MKDLLADTLFDAGRSKESLPLRREVEAYYVAQAQGSPPTTRSIFAAAMATRKLGDILAELGRRDEAVVAWRAALTRIRESGLRDEGLSKLEQQIALAMGSSGIDGDGVVPARVDRQTGERGEGH
jgi:hypothetical protein